MNNHSKATGGKKNSRTNYRINQNKKNKMFFSDLNCPFPRCESPLPPYALQYQAGLWTCCGDSSDSVIWPYS